jgi:competence CoiA-like predicted nuclease
MARVSEFYYLKPSMRPEAICPVCMNPVIMKLGNERVYHYAHQPDIVCCATQKMVFG